MFIKYFLKVLIIFQKKQIFLHYALNTFHWSTTYDLSWFHWSIIRFAAFINPHFYFGLGLVCLSARSVPQILSIKGDCTFLLSNLLIICFCNSSADFLFEICFAEIFFYRNIYKPLKQFRVAIYHISDL